MQLQEKLTRDQQNAVTRLLHFSVENVEENFLLTGGAGTGKSYVMGAFLKKLTETKSIINIALTAPTNQAVGVLNELLSKFNIFNVDCMTIYRLLGLQVSEGDGEELLLKEKSLFRSNSNYDLVIVDEAFMIEEDLWNILQYKVKGKKIFVGDDAQLLPVKNKTSPILGIRNKFILGQIVRQAIDSPLTATISACRKLVYFPCGKFTPICSVKPDKSAGVWTCDRQQWMEVIVRAFNSENAQKDLNHSKVITFRNNTADNLNLEIRQKIVDSSESFIEGETLITKDAVFSENGKYVLIPIASKVIVKAASSYTYIMQQVSTLTLAEILAWKLKVEYEGKTINITTIDPKHQSIFESNLQALANLAKQTNQRAELYSPEWEESRSYWQIYWKTRKLVASVSYRYTQTVRRSQGRSYKNVFIYSPDFLNIQNLDNRWRCLYVAVSRASEKLFFTN